MMAHPKRTRRFLAHPATATHLVAAHAAARDLGYAIGPAHLLDLLGLKPGLPTRAEFVTRVYLNDDPDLCIHVRRIVPIYAFAETLGEDKLGERIVMSVLGEPEGSLGSRAEIEVEVLQTQWSSLANLSVGRALASTRYRAQYSPIPAPDLVPASAPIPDWDTAAAEDGHALEIAIEIFDAEFAGLVVLEADFPLEVDLPQDDCRPTEIFRRSDLFAREITHDRRLDWLALARMDLADIAVFLAEICSKPSLIFMPEIDHA